MAAAAMTLSSPLKDNNHNLLTTRSSRRQTPPAGGDGFPHNEEAVPANPAITLKRPQPRRLVSVTAWTKHPLKLTLPYDIIQESEKSNGPNKNANETTRHSNATLPSFARIIANMPNVTLITIPMTTKTKVVVVMMIILMLETILLLAVDNDDTTNSNTNRVTCLRYSIDSKPKENYGKWSNHLRLKMSLFTTNP